MYLLPRPISTMFLGLYVVLSMSACSSTEIIDSPRTAFASEAGPEKNPDLIWTSRTLTQEFDYLGQIKVKSLTYNGALGRLMDAGKDMRADAIIDVHYEQVGFLNTMHAFAVKYK